MYKLISENLTGLGGPMGTERTWSNYTKYFKTVKAAKEFAEKDFDSFEVRNGRYRKLVWHKDRDYYRTDDMGYVMYYIKKVKVEG